MKLNLKIGTLVLTTFMALNVTAFSLFASTIVDQAPVITAANPTVTVTSGEVLDYENMQAMGLTAYDLEDGDLTDKIEVLSNPFSFKGDGTDAITTTTPYPMLYTVKDSGGSQPVLKIDIVVKEPRVNQLPEMVAEQKTINISRGEMLDYKDMDAMGITAYDFEDGDLTDYIQVLANPNSFKGDGTDGFIGQSPYPIMYCVTDSEGGQQVLSVNVVVN